MILPLPIYFYSTRTPAFFRTKEVVRFNTSQTHCRYRKTGRRRAASLSHQKKVSGLRSIRSLGISPEKIRKIFTVSNEVGHIFV